MTPCNRKARSFESLIGDVGVGLQKLAALFDDVYSTRCKRLDCCDVGDIEQDRDFTEDRARLGHGRNSDITF